MVEGASRLFCGKIILKGKIRAITGLRIGAPGEVGEIGGIDNPVIRDPVTGEPYIPGSSLKGKLRSLFERYYAPNSGLPPKTGEGNFFGKKIHNVWIHVCKNYEDALKCPVCRLFGSSGNENFPSRLIVRDSFLTEESRDKLREISPTFTEAKTEVAIDRVTSAATPRTSERIVAGAEFEFEMIYNVEDPEQLKEDLENLITSLKLLEDSYLGGSGSRGYGKVKVRLEEVIFRTPEYYKTGDLRMQKKLIDQAVDVENVGSGLIKIMVQRVLQDEAVKKIMEKPNGEKRETSQGRGFENEDKGDIPRGA